MSKRVLNFKTPEQTAILKRLYSEGMMSYGKDNEEGRRLLKQAVDETKLSEDQIKVSFLFQYYIKWMTGSCYFSNLNKLLPEFI